MNTNPKMIINISQQARSYLCSLKKLDPHNIYLRVSVKQGGCSGMAYSMTFENKQNIKKTDQVMDYIDFQVVCDNKSILYLYGMSLEYKDDLIGGGLHFINPNARQTCGCGQSFSI